MASEEKLISSCVDVLSTCSATKDQDCHPPATTLPTPDDKEIAEDKDEKKDEEEDDIILNTTVHGVFSLTREVRLRPKIFNPSAVLRLESLTTHWKKRISLYPYVYRFFMECFYTSPIIMSAFLLMKFWDSLRIQYGITTHRIDGRALAEIIILRLVAVALECFVTSKSDKLRVVLRRKVRYLVLRRMVQTNLNFDFPTYKDSEYINRTDKYFRQYMHSDDIWDQFERLVGVWSDVTMVFSQISFLYYLLRTQPGGIWFILVAAIRPLSDRNLLSGSQLSEWRAAVTGLGDTSETIPSTQYLPGGDFTAMFQREMISQLPLVYLNPKAFSLSSIALMEQATSMIDQILTGLFGRSYYEPIDFEWMKSLYEGSTEKNMVQDGQIMYPSADDKEPSNGMEVEFRNVSFSYPKTKETVLNDISFTIKKGQTVVIVGMNGSGKSTLLKLINRIYDVSSGTVYVDSQPLKSYVSSTVRRAMAILFQEFTHFPVSIAENIYLGCPDPDPEGEESDIADFSQDMNNEKTRQAIEQAAELGGSVEIIKKQKKGLDTVFRPVTAFDFENYDTASQKLLDFIAEHTLPGVLSSGQWQRLALSRLFYRAAMKHVKLIAADEPSASLDPQIEYQIFSRLYELSAKQVMKDGKLVEQGRHADLLALNNEYANLYKVQAEAFLSDEELKESTPNTPEFDARSIDTSEASDE
ncbi:hypothetical protein Clacol_004234 [Clathrus columnatus]|uniref:ABC transporter domain-containing protein n=1 Tax=Clathrus columnatus TaxID=1419009 RepID=A0AAV5A974_9AGAM|nr:hypothetical protein Clacol_004234 [Clathrus columnatus]